MQGECFAVACLRDFDVAVFSAKGDDGASDGGSDRPKSTALIKKVRGLEGGITSCAREGDFGEVAGDGDTNLLGGRGKASFGGRDIGPTS